MTHAKLFLGPELAALIDDPDFDEVAQLTWSDGLIVTARVAMPGWDYTGPDPREVLRAIVNSPAAMCLRELTVGVLDFEGAGLEDVAQDIASGGELPCLERLFIGDFAQSEREISWVDIGDVSPLYPLTPALRWLRLHGAGIELGALEHPTLESLIVETGGLPRSSVASIAAANLPKLVELELWFGRPEYGGTTDFGAIAPIFTTTTLPALRDLGLQNSEIQDALAIALANSPLLAQLVRVDLSMGTMHGPGAEAILAHAPAFEQLESLDLTRNYIPSELVERLRATFGDIVRVEDQRTADVEDGEPNYYAAVGE